MKQMRPFAGKWRIVEMEVPEFIRIGSDGTGRFQFGLVSRDSEPR